MKQVTDENIVERIALLEHAEAETGQLSLHGETELAWLRGFRDLRTAHAVLQQKLDAMAAENAALKSNLMFWDAEDPESPYDCPEDIANNCCMDFNTEFDVQVAAKMPNRTYRVSAVGEYDCKIELVSGGMPETPATDAYLNSVRAEGVEMFVKDYAQRLRTTGGAHGHHSEPYKEMADHVEEKADIFAEQLRSGFHDTANKAG